MERHWVHQAPEGYWQRGAQAYGRPGDYFVVRLYWPIGLPTRPWWGWE